MNIDKYYTWNKLRKINSSKIINSMYIWIFIVPIIVKVFEAMNGGIYDFVMFEETIKIKLELPFSLIIFYFSAIAFAIGNLIIVFKCPLIIQENDSYNTYESSGKKLKQLKEYIEDIGYDWGKLANEIDEQIDKRFDVHKTISSWENKAKAEEEKENPKNYFWQIYDEAKESNTTFRFFGGLSYLIGFTLLAIVLIQNFIFIVKTLFPQLSI